MFRPKSKFSYGTRSKSSSLLTLNEIDALEKSMDWKKDYNVQTKEIGRGHFSKVLLVTNSTSGISYAAKVIRRRKGGIDRLDKIRKEAEIIRKLNDNKVLSIIQLIETHESFSDVILICELAKGGSLFTLIQNADEELDQNYVKCIIRKVLSALESMHLLNIVHLDIKADNILLREPCPSTDVALCDFGLATELKKDINHKELVGTPDYMAPEVVNYEKITFNADMWSVGVLTYHLLTRISPFMGSSKEETLVNVSKVQILFDSIFDNDDYILAKDFILSLCKKLPGARLTSTTAQQHKWLENINEADLGNIGEHLNNSKSNIFEILEQSNPPHPPLRPVSLYNGQRCRSDCLKSLDLNCFDMPDSPYLYSSTSGEVKALKKDVKIAHENDGTINDTVVNNNHTNGKRRDLSNVDESPNENVDSASQNDCVFQDFDEKHYPYFPSIVRHQSHQVFESTTEVDEETLVELQQPIPISLNAEIARSDHQIVEPGEKCLHVDVEVHTNETGLIIGANDVKSHLNSTPSLNINMEEYDNISETCDDRLPGKVPLSRQISSSSSGIHSYLSCGSDKDEEVQTKYTSIFAHLRLSDMCILL